MPWLEDTHEAVNVLHEEAFFLENKGQDLRSVGLTMLGAELMRCAANIEEACKRIKDALGEEIRDQVNKSHDMDQTLLKGVLAGIIWAGKIENIVIDEPPQ